MRLWVMGMGYVGLVAAVGFAKGGHRVTGVDVDLLKLEKLKIGQCPIYEPGLEALLTETIQQGNLDFTDRLDHGLGEADAIFICVGTPPCEDGSADLQYVLEAARDIGRHMASRQPSARPLLVVNKSTVPVGTHLRVQAAIQKGMHTAFQDKDQAKPSFEVISNPEFLREGCALEDFLFPDRVVVGCQSEYAANAMKRLYQDKLEAAQARDPQRGQWICMDPASAELTKYAANAMLALRIAFINEMANLCESVGADIDHVKAGIASDHRIGKHFLNPGPGFGGSCFPKDLQALLKTGREHGHHLMSLATTVEANRHQKQVLAMKIKRYFKIHPGLPNPLSGKRFALWGLAFKAHTDDVRESMSLELIDTLCNLGAEIVAHDFEAMDSVKRSVGNRIQYALDPMEACKDADALIIATEWPSYKDTDLECLAGALKEKLIFDGRNLFRPEDMQRKGWIYHSIGRLTRGASLE